MADRPIGLFRQLRCLWESVEALQAGGVGDGGSPSSISDVSGLQAALDGKQATGSYALTAHNHDYAAPDHNHTGVYALASHNHVIADVSGLQTALDGKQASGSYSLASHDHTGVYALASHSHTIANVTGLQTALDGKQASGSYSLTSHDHSGVYQAAGNYAAASHSHIIADVTGLQAALDGKQASGSYALASHNHDAAYAAIGHNHSGVYQPVGSYLTVFGYTTGAGGTVSQSGNKSTAVTLNKLTGEITMVNSALAAGAIVTFVLNNSTVAAGDMLVVSHHSGGTIGPYLINGRVTGAGAASIAVRNTSAGSLSDAVVIKFAVIKTVTA